MVAIHEALTCQQRGWSVIPIIPGTKRPPERFHLSQYFERPATEREICRWFQNGLYNMAVCLGDVSDGLTCRDFDDLSSYERWSSNYSRLSNVLPTVRTARGTHVYCTSGSGDFGDREIITGRDGELKRGGYTLLPNSVHPTGACYEWLAEFDDVPFVSDLESVGLLPQKARATQDIYPLGDRGGMFFRDLTVEQCIESTQPTGHGERHYCLFAFARMLKATDLIHASADELKPPFNRWLALARPRIRTKCWKTNWKDFFEGWNRIRLPYGATMNAIAKKATGEGIEKLESLCRELQRIAGEEPFYLDCRTAGRLLGVHYTSAARWLRILCSGPLERLRKGDRKSRRATEYRFKQ